jgi:putative hemolysin
MLAGVLNVERRLVREIMTPRRRVEAVPGSASVGEALSQLADSAHTRFPVTGGPDDDVVGIVHLRDLFIRAQADPSTTVASIARPVTAVGEVLTVPKLWRTLREDAQHCAIVVNEYGSVSGVVTLEDAIEEIFGEVHDEFDLGEEPISVAKGRVSVRGDVLLAVLSERFGADLRSDGVDTVGGLLWHKLGRLPTVGDEVRVEPGGILVRVDAIDGRAVERASFELPGEAR